MINRFLVDLILPFAGPLVGTIWVNDGTVIMLQINWLLSGVIVVEFFFAYKGFGALILEASLNNDIALLEACAMVAVCVAVTTQTIADIGYTFLNPRIRFS